MKEGNFVKFKEFTQNMFCIETSGRLESSSEKKSDAALTHVSCYQISTNNSYAKCYYNFQNMKAKKLIKHLVCVLSRVQLFATPYTTARQALFTIGNIVYTV